MPERFSKIIDASFTQLTITQPELFLPIKLFLIAVLGLAVLGSVFLARVSFLRISMVLVLWVGALVATKAMFLISADGSFYQYRYNVAMGFFPCLYSRPIAACGDH